MKKEKLPARRVRVLVAILVLWGVGIAARLCFIQVVQSSYYVDKAAKHQRYEVKITPPRGDILDRDGDVLASSIESYSVNARPSKMKDPRAVAKSLARLTGLPVNDLIRKLDPAKRFVFVKRKISEREWRAIENAQLPEVGFEVEYRRFYPYGEMAAHLLGFVDVDELGRGGLEAKYDNVVRGEAGKVVGFRDALGNAYEHEKQVPQPGATLTTTLDKNTQYIVEKEIRVAADQTHAAGISVVVMDPNSGALLAMASSPTFNPNNYVRFPQSNWTNPSVEKIYEPGSTFKPVTIAAALEEGLTTPDEQIFCENGVLALGRRKIHDHHPYGWLSVREIMQNSSNIGTIKLGIRVGDERLKSYIDRFGFGQKTAVDLPAEVPGKVYDLSEWEKTSIASVSMGHELSVTPLQIAVMVSAVANGGIRYKPYVVQKIDDPRTGVTEIKPSGTRVISQTTAQQLRLMLEDVVTDGTAKTSRLAGYRAAGKTGTAEKANTVSGGYYGSKFVSSFAGFVPVSNPKLAIVVVIDDPKGKYYGGEVAAPVFKRIAEQVLLIKSVAPDVPDYVPPRYPVTPERNKQKPTSPTETKKRDFNVLDVTSRTGQAGIPNGAIIVPDFTGQSMRQAMDESGKLGLEYRFSGSGLVVTQDPPPGTPVRPGTRLRFTLSLN